jgi:hypothetical protein
MIMARNLHTTLTPVLQKRLAFIAKRTTLSKSDVVRMLINAEYIRQRAIDDELRAARGG